MLTKICTKCKVELPANGEFFNKRSRNKSGLRSECNDCRKRYNKENAEKIATQQKQYYMDNKEKILIYIKQYSKDNTEKKAEYLKQYAKNNTEKLSVYYKNYAKENAEKIAEYKKQYAKSNFEIEAERKKKWVKDNSERFSEYQKLYKKNNSQGCRINNQRREAIKKSLISDFTAEQWERCLVYFDYKDAYTGLPMDVPSQDHVIPLSKGGDYTVTNIVPCNKSINSSKGNRDMLTWFRKQPYHDIERENRILIYIKSLQH